MYFLYLIKSLKRKWYYIGCTEDVVKRLAQHNRGAARSTKVYRPFRLIYHEAFSNKRDALRREYELKHSGQQKEKLFYRLGLQ